MLVQVSDQLKTNTGLIKFRLTHNPKLPLAVVYIGFNTQHKALLSALLNKYVTEKCLDVGMNANNNIVSAIPGETSIVLTVPEKKVLSNVALLVSYLHKTALSAVECAYLQKDPDYDGLSKSIGNIEVVVTGKCKTVIGYFKNKSSKIELFINTINGIEPKANRVAKTGRKKIESCIGKTHEFTASPEAQLYLSICMGNVPYTMNGNKITILTPCGCCDLMQKLVHSSVFNAKVKTFLTQSGAYGTPSRNDAGGAKWQQKKERISACQRELAYIYSRVRGFTYKEAPEQVVNTEALKSVTSLEIHC